MKKSNIILLILALSVPTFLLTYNYLLKERYLAGQLTYPDYSPESQYMQEELPAAQHIVLDGKIQIEQGPIQVNDKIWKVNSDGQQAKAEIKFPKIWEEMIKIKLINDTLFISTEKNIANGNLAIQLNNLPKTNAFAITLPAIRSFSLQSGRCNFEGAGLGNNLTLSARNAAMLEVNNSDANKVQVHIDDEAQIEFLQKNTISNLSYALYANAQLSISDESNITQLHQEHADAQSKISITAKASELQKQMAKIGEASK